jgi:hypothetical protein
MKRRASYCDPAQRPVSLPSILQPSGGTPLAWRNGCMSLDPLGWRPHTATGQRHDFFLQRLQLPYRRAALASDGQPSRARLDTSPIALEQPWLVAHRTMLRRLAFSRCPYALVGLSAPGYIAIYGVGWSSVDFIL